MAYSAFEKMRLLNRQRFGKDTGPPVPQDICEKEYRAAIREQTRCHAMAMDGEVTKEEIFRHYRNCLHESEKEKDFEPFNCMLRLIRRFDGLRIYRFAYQNDFRE
jgi:hypothetical protein